MQVTPRGSAAAKHLSQDANLVQHFCCVHVGLEAVVRLTDCPAHAEGFEDVEEELPLLLGREGTRVLGVKVDQELAELVGDRHPLEDVLVAAPNMAGLTHDPCCDETPAYMQ